jgi:N-acetylmuramoyl-L-alanine amidase
MATVVIDPGHGGTGKIGGSSGNNATSPSGLLEKDLTLAVAQHARAALAARQHAVTLTRAADVNLSLAARAAVARTAGADAFVSIHFNGFGDTSVQGTETWVHASASGRSAELAGCIQRAVLGATAHKDRGVRRKELGVVDPANHANGTAACLAELSFITTSAEDARLKDPAYLKALGDAIADGVHDFVAPEETAASPSLAEMAPGAAAAGRARAFRADVAFAASTEVSPAAAAVSTVRPPVADVRAAIDALKTGRKKQYAGPVKPGGDPAQSHIQGLAAYKDVFLLTHSDANEKSGRILVLDRASRHKVIAEFRLPVFARSGPAFFHAGGCQVIGDVLAVPSETGQNASVVAFFDVSDPLRIREFNGALRVLRDSRDAAAVGLTTLTRNGQTVWLLAVYDSGTVDFYESPDFPGGALFEPRFTRKVEEKNHQHLLLFTDARNRVFAVGLNRGNFPFFDRVMVYAVDPVKQTLTADPERRVSTGGGTRLRWGATYEAVGNQLSLHCTDRDYGDSCAINSFHPPQSPAARAVRKRAVRKRAATARAARSRKSPARRKPARNARTKRATTR